MNEKLKEQLLQKIILEKEEKTKNSKITRKERSHKLILKGTIFERLGLLDESEEFLLGLILSTKFYKITDKSEYEKLGIMFKEKRW